jgi:DNA-directed RNA polymerase specialized sigma24 family protein
MNEEERIVARLREQPRDERAWADFYAHYRRQIIAILFFRGTRNVMDLDDFTAEVFFRFLIQSPWHDDWGSLSSGSEVRRYLLGSASSIASHAWQRVQRRTEIEKQLPPLESAHPGEAPFLDFAYVLKHLAAPDKELAILYYQNGMSLPKVAEHYHTTYAYAGVRLHRIRRKILAIIREKPISKA